MTKRNEKPSPHESSTDTIIAALGIVADLIDQEANYPEYLTLVEATLRLDKLETELINCRNKALDDAANACINVMNSNKYDYADGYDLGADHCADAILKLKESKK
jgi:hypothetical protein